MTSITETQSKTTTQQTSVSRPSLSCAPTAFNRVLSQCVTTQLPFDVEKINATLQAHLNAPRYDPRLDIHEQISAISQNQISPLGEQIAAKYVEFEAVFENLGMPIIDALKFSKSDIGTYSVSGVGKGVEISNPQAEFVQAVLNGKIPELKDATEKLHAIIDDMETLHGQIQSFRAEIATLRGDEFHEVDGLFANNVIFGANASQDIAASGRELSWKHAEKFEDFKADLGTEAEDMLYDQLLTRFYFEQNMRGDLAKRYPDYFA